MTRVLFVIGTLLARGELGKMIFVVHLEKLSQSERTAYVTNQPIRTQTTGHLIASGG